MAWLLLVLLAPPAWLLISSITSSLRNYAIARKVGLPTFFVPISPENPLWIMMGRHIVPWAKHVPFGSASFSRFGYTGWEWTDKFQAALEHGDAILLVSPDRNWIYVSNAETIHDTIQHERRRDFEGPVELLAVLDVFGQNISTVKPDDWSRHRKVTASTFSEKANRIV